MIPFGGESAVLPSVERTGLRQNNIAFTLVQAPNQLTSISSSPTINNSFSPGIRILQSRSQHRRSSVSSLCSLLKFEDNEFRKLNSRGSSVGELRLCLETKQLASKQFECTENLDNSSCSSTGTEEGKDQEADDHPNNMTFAVATDNTSPDIKNNVESRKVKCKSRAKSNSRTKSKKRSKSKKSAKTKGNAKSLNKVPSVFERLSNVTKNSNSQDKLDSSSNSMKKNSTIFFNRSSGNLLEIKRLKATYMPVTKPSKPKTLLCLPRVSMSKASTCQSPRQTSCHSIPTASNHVTVISPRKSLDTIIRNDCNTSTKKVYLSEVQSKMIGGIPCAPPATPFPDEQTRIEYIPCLMDIKSQRAVKSKLEKIVTKLKTEEEQRKEYAIKQNQKRLKESLIQLKQQQRAEIYALNKVMTELENENFKTFMMKKDAVSTMGV